MPGPCSACPTPSRGSPPAARSIADGLTVRQTEALVATGIPTASKPRIRKDPGQASPTRAPHFVELEEHLKVRFGTPVAVRPKGQGPGPDRDRVQLPGRVRPRRRPDPRLLSRSSRISPRRPPDPPPMAPTPSESPRPDSKSASPSLPDSRKMGSHVASWIATDDRSRRVQSHELPAISAWAALNGRRVSDLRSGPGLPRSRGSRSNSRVPCGPTRGVLE